MIEAIIIKLLYIRINHIFNKINGMFFDSIHENHQYLKIFQVISDSNLISDIKTVLDVGSGVGTTQFSILGIQYDAIDTDQTKLNELIRKINELKLNSWFNVINESFIEHDFKDKKYDLIIMNNFLNVIPHNTINENFKKAFSLLKENRLISISVNTLNKTDLQRTKKNKLEIEIEENKFYRESDDSYYNYFSLSEMKQYLREAKFRIERWYLEELFQFQRQEMDSTYHFIASK